MAYTVWLSSPQQKEPLLTPALRSTAAPSLSRSQSRRLLPTSCVATRTSFRSTWPSTPTLRCSSSPIPAPWMKLIITVNWWALLKLPKMYQKSELHVYFSFLPQYEMVKQAAENIRRYYRNVYTYGAGAKTICKYLYNNLLTSWRDMFLHLFLFADLAPGGSDDWAHNLGIKYSFTFELQDRGRYGFLLPPSYIQGASNEALIALKTIALKVIEKTQAAAGSPQNVWEGLTCSFDWIFKCCQLVTLNMRNH